MNCIAKIQHLLDHCQDQECEMCSKIVCPQEDENHFHHDGCPSCVDERPDRKTVLLKAAYDLLKKSNEAEWVDPAHEIVVHYDGADCDGGCLMEDIATELGLNSKNEN